MCVLSLQLSKKDVAFPSYVVVEHKVFFFDLFKIIKDNIYTFLLVYNFYVLYHILVFSFFSLSLLEGARTTNMYYKYLVS